MVESAEIKDTDIVFDCPYCGKSLAIDYRGAGLSIPCSDCGRSVEVPIPQGMEITDIDSSDEEQEIRILNLRRSLAVAEERIEHLEGMVEELQARREALEKSRSNNMYRLALIAEKAGVIQQSLAEMSKAVSAIMDATTSEA